MTRNFDPPETMEQAKEWDRRKSAYVRAGLCHPCAATASYGHQLGWHRTQYPPCVDCVPVVATFPQETVDPAWRKWPRGRPSVPAMRSAAQPCVQASPDVSTGLNGGQG